MKFLPIPENDPRWNRIRDLFGKNRKRWIPITLCVVALVLMVASEWIGFARTTREPITEPTVDYAKTLEEQLSKLIATMDGAGRTEVMVTLRSSPETVYARNSKTRTGVSEEAEDEESYVLLRSGSAENGLELKTITPSVLGVAVVCEGADNPQVRQSITDTVTAALGIRGSHVSVVKMKSERK